jgi:heat shock protein 5
LRSSCVICVVSPRQRTTLHLAIPFTDAHPRIGDAAKNAFATNPENTVFDAKRLIGRKIDDPEIKKDMKHWPFGVVEKNGKPYIRVKHRGDQKDFVRSLY